MGKCLYEIKECEYKSDGMCSYRCSYEEKENANFGYPLLAEVLAEFEKELRSFGIVLDDLPRKIIKGVLSKYFS